MNWNKIKNNKVLISLNKAFMIFGLIIVFIVDDNYKVKSFKIENKSKFI